MRPVSRWTTMILVTAGLSSTGAARNLLVNGNFETGDLTGWTEMQPHYPGAGTMVFAETLDGYPMLAPYAGAYACGWVRPPGNWVWDARDSTQPSNAIFQDILVEPGAYPVHAGAAFFCHHDRRNEPPCNWGCGIRVSLYVDGNHDEPAWRHEFWVRDAESFWRYRPALSNSLAEDAADGITTRTGRVRFEIAWITKWTVNRDICAVDNVSLELGERSGKGYPDPVNKPPAYRPQARIGPADAGFAAGTFLEPDHYPVGLHPNSLVVADFDGDGFPDIAAANLWSHTISILANDGAGRFGAARDLACGRNPRHLVVADVNADGHADLVVSCRGEALVQTFLGDGAGGFGAPISTPTPAGPWRIAVGHLDDDGFPDLVVSNDSENTALVFLGNGDGSFRHLTTVEGDAMTAGAVIGDFRGEGVNDLLVFSWWDAVARVYRNEQARFIPYAKLDLPWQTESAVCADFNVDGIIDMVAGGLHSSTVRYYLGRRDAAFVPAPASIGPRVPTDICTGFWDRDDIPDLALTSFDVHEFSLWRTRNIWDPELSPAELFRSYAAGYQPRALASDDFNSDGIPDFAVAASGDHEIRVFMGLPGPVWRGSTTHFPPDWFPHLRCAAVGDFDKDGVLDVAVGLVNGVGQASVKFLRNDGRDILTAVQPPEYPLPAEPLAMATGDFDGDGDDDVAVAVAAGGILLFRCHGNVTFRHVATIGESRSIVDLVAADIDGNGKLDLVAADEDSSSLIVYAGDGAGSFEQAGILPLPGPPAALRAGDFGTVPGRGIAAMLRNSGTVVIASFADPAAPCILHTIRAPADLVDIACGDLDGDGRTDIAAAAGGSGGLLVFHGRPDGGFDIEEVSSLDVPIRCLAVADFDGDGLADIAIGLRDERKMLLVRSRPGREREPAEIYGCVGRPRALIPAALWGTGRPDLICTPEDVPRIQVFANAF